MAIKAADREGKRVTLSVRLTPDGRARLSQAASANGCSLAQEVETRLDRSFDRDDLRMIIREELRAELRAELRSELRLVMAEVVLEDGDDEADEARH